MSGIVGLRSLESGKRDAVRGACVNNGAGGDPIVAPGDMFETLERLMMVIGIGVGGIMVSSYLWVMGVTEEYLMHKGCMCG